MDLPAFAPMALPAAAELGLALLLWACAALLSLHAFRPAAGDRVTDRVRLGMLATATGLGQWAALLCVLTALTGAGAARAEPLPMLVAWVLAAAVAGLPLRAATGPAALSALAAVASVCGLGAALLLLAASLGVGMPPATVLIAVALALAASQAALAQVQRGVAAAGDAMSAAGRAWRALVVALAFAAPLLLVVGMVPAAVSPHGSTGGPWVLALCALVAMAFAGAALFFDQRGGAANRRPPKRLRAAAPRADGAAQTDALTSLPNRAGFEAWLAPALNATTGRGGRLALLVIGLDGFKQVNLLYGMRGGDAVLSEVARRLGAACREVSTAPKLVTGQLARTGGDEFTLAVQGAPDRDEAARIASRLVEMLAKPVPFEGTEVDIRVSVGVACAPEDGGVDTLQTHGEAALRAAKERGGGVYALFDEAREQLDLLHDLRRAIDERRLELFYQPKIDAQSGQVTAAEALLRWNHPTRGMVSPAVFIPLAERYGLIRALGDWVIDDACRQARVWRKAGLKMRVAINLSAHQMRDEGLIDRILEALARHGIDPSRLTCEITETVAMEDTQVTQNTFELLGEAGIHLSIDDFGTGQSSLAYLRRLPAAELKIDRAFVKDLGASDEARAIVNAIVQLAHALGKRVVAEGVETVRQRDVLLELGCDEWQGFLFAKPMSARALQMWALDDRRDQNAFRPSLFADTNTPTRFVAPERGPRQVEPARAAVPER